MRRASHFIPAVIGFAWALGCASTESTLETSEAGTEVVEAAAEMEPQKPIDPAYIAGPPLPEMAAALPNETVDAPEAPLAEEETSAETSPSFWRADGRPAWWLAEPRREDGRVTITAEAIGTDLSDARARAIEAGRAALAREAGPAPGGERVESLLVRRLEGDAPGRARYVGYARLSAREPERVNP